MSTGERGPRRRGGRRRDPGGRWRTLVETIEGHPALPGALDRPALLDLFTPPRPRSYSISSYLHADELRAAEAAGAVSLRPAFSAVAAAGTGFVQHRIAAEADEVWGPLESGARVYVCGDGSRTAPGVRSAFRTLHADRVPGGDPLRWLDRLIADGRYVEDVYAAG
ncbi:ferredoxin reductase domain-containing protein [Streptomyces sp. ME109]|uniref:hypothetical protein n=1 Tax=Streptomyces sp. me109 TaxID=1827853 RepID=UPI001C9C2108